MNENQVLDLLNHNLREQVIANLNGRVLNACEVFDNFDMMFVSEITFQLERRIYVMNDPIFEEGSIGNSMYFIGKGSVILIHRKSHTFIKLLEENSSFGQAAFFSNKLRCASARSNTFTEMLELDLESFSKALTNHKNDEILFNKINDKINNQDDYSDIRILCYICKELGKQFINQLS